MNISSSEMTEEDKSVVDKTKKEIEKVYKGIMDLFDEYDKMKDKKSEQSADK